MSPSVKSNKVLLVYPFDGREDVIEEAARGLNEASIQIRNGSQIPVQRAANTETESGESQEKSVRAHYLTIRDEDRLRLINEEFLNDTLVDFWMQW
jgi:Ulp1 family protease